MLMPFLLPKLAPAGPALPAVAGRSKNVSAAANATTYAVTLPSGITAGEILLVAVAADGAGTLTEASGLWTKLGQTSSSTLVTAVIFWKVAAGSDTLTVDNTASDQYSHMAWRIANANTVNGTGLAGTASADANPPNHTFPDGSKDALVIAFAAHDGTTVATAAPSGYSNFDTQVGGSAGASSSAAELAVTASSEDPGAFTSAAVRHVTYTLAIYQN